MCFRCLFFFFFKQKTAYEMRISDWSSDVCSSDLIAKVLAEALGRRLIRLQCYEGLDTASAVYEWNYQAQMIEIRLAEAEGKQDREALGKEDRKSTRLNSSHYCASRMPSSA